MLLSANDFQRITGPAVLSFRFLTEENEQETIEHIQGCYEHSMEMSQHSVVRLESLDTGGSRISLKGGGQRKTIHDCLHYTKALYCMYIAYRTSVSVVTTICFIMSTRDVMCLIWGEINL